MATIHARVILGVAVTAFKKEMYLYDIKMPSFNSRITPNEEVGTIRARGDAPKGSESFCANLMVGNTAKEQLVRFRPVHHVKQHIILRADVRMMRRG